MIIYILNDENTDKILKSLKSIHCGRGIEQDIYIYNDASELLENCVEKGAHVAIFNEKLERCTGYEYACRLRMIDKNILPIIIRGEDAIDEKAGEAELFGCITCDNMDSKLPGLIGYAAKRVQRPDSCLLSYYWNNCERTIELEKVLYFCSRHRVVDIIGINGVEGTFYSKLDEVEAELIEQSVNFIRISKSYLVNPKHILEKTEHEVTLDNGEKLNITKKYSENIKN